MLQFPILIYGAFEKERFQLFFMLPLGKNFQLPRIQGHA
jgi:hypothetical protein